jgi:hypothetical protein
MEYGVFGETHCCAGAWKRDDMVSDVVQKRVKTRPLDRIRVPMHVYVP